MIEINKVYNMDCLDGMRLMDEIEFYLKDLESRFKGIDKSKYYLSYSGGKDSHFLYWFIKEYLHDNEIEIVGVNTYMEHKEILQRINKYSDRVLYPTMKPFEIKEKYGSPCFSKEQDFYIYYYQNALRKGNEPAKTIQQKVDGTYDKGFSGISKKAREYVTQNHAHNISHLCCKYLKKEPFRLYEKESGRKAILGIRSSESMLRKQQYKSCFTKDKKFIPLHDLSNELLNQIYDKYDIEIPKVYEHISRTGCMGCPYGSYKGETQKELKLMTPQQKKFVCELFKESYQILGIKTNDWEDDL